MTITQLKYVLSVAEHKNFTVASQHSFVTQPTLSMQIQKLEDEFDIQIFNRSKKPIELTSIGEKIVEQAKIIVNESHRFADIVHQYKGFIGGEFNLGMIPTVMPTLLPMFLNNFTKKYPKVKLIIEELTTEEILSQLDNVKKDELILSSRDQIKGKVNFEIKTDSLLQPQIDILFQKMLPILHPEDIVTSFNWKSIQDFKELFS